MNFFNTLNLLAHEFRLTYLFSTFLLCACIGSYFNLFAWRWPQIQERNWIIDIKEWFESKGWPQPDVKTPAPISLSYPRSFCPTCQTPISVKYNIPILGWLMLRGKSACCSQKISAKYPTFEFLCGCIGGFSAAYFPSVETTLMFLIFAMALCMASQTDLESMMLPDSINIFILFIGLGLCIFFNIPQTPKQSFLSIVIFFSSLSAIRFFGSIAFKREAMGQGDPKFLAAIGAWVPVESLPIILLTASLSGLIYAIMLKALHKENATVPFGPFLAIGGLVAYLIPVNQFYRMF